MVFVRVSVEKSCTAHISKPSGLSVVWALIYRKETNTQAVINKTLCDSGLISDIIDKSLKVLVIKGIYSLISKPSQVNRIVG